MIKKLLNRMFFSKINKNDVIKDLKSNPNFKTIDDIKIQDSNDDQSTEHQLKKGEIELVTLPDLGNQKDLTLTKWFFNSGDMIKKGDIVCEVSNENILMELESFCDGKIWHSCKLNDKLLPGSEIFKIEGQ
jgi:hypothetical protein